MITGDSNLGRLLDEHPELVEVLAAYHAHFARLRNRGLRRVMAPRVTVAQAARVAGVPAADLVAAIRRAVGVEMAPVAAGHDIPNSTGNGTGGDTPSPRPAALDGLTAVEVDVREDIRKGVEPLARIMTAAKALGSGKALTVRAPFEPVPLYDVLGQRGFGHWTEPLDDGDWRVWFFRRETDTPAAEAAAAPRVSESPAGTAVGDVETIDVRGLEPPLPMVRVLERLDALPPGGTLRVLHERRPMFLYPQLDHRGFRHGTDELAPGVVEIVIRRPEA